MAREKECPCPHCSKPMTQKEQEAADSKHLANRVLLNQQRRRKEIQEIERRNVFRIPFTRIAFKFGEI